MHHEGWGLTLTSKVRPWPKPGSIWTLHKPGNIVARIVTKFACFFLLWNSSGFPVIFPGFHMFALGWVEKQSRFFKVFPIPAVLLPSCAWPGSVCHLQVFELSRSGGPSKGLAGRSQNRWPVSQGGPGVKNFSHIFWGKYGKLWVNLTGPHP